MCILVVFLLFKVLLYRLSVFIEFMNLGRWVGVSKVDLVWRDILGFCEFLCLEVIKIILLVFFVLYIVVVVVFFSKVNDLILLGLIFCILWGILLIKINGFVFFLKEFIFLI